jgi:glutamate formiminotransferase/formiminotetrahydrofolate cyclodeaminase
VEIAQKIAKTIRASSGGLPHVKALGLLVAGRAQVSMNLTNFRETSVQLAVETIRSEAHQAGVDIHHCELIGLIPQAALTDAAASYLHLNGFTPDRVLENRLQPAAPVPTPTTPVAIAASSAAMAAGLVAGVVGQTLGKAKHAEAQAELKTIQTRAEALRGELTQSIRDDAAALEKITAAFKRHSANKAEIIEQAALDALQVPLNVARHAVEIMHLADRCALLGNLSAIADAAAAVSLARGALIAAGYNIRINADALQKKSNGEPAVFEVDALEARAARINRQTRHTLRERAGLKLE